MPDFARDGHDRLYSKFIWIKLKRVHAQRNIHDDLSNRRISLLDGHTSLTRRVPMMCNKNDSFTKAHIYVFASRYKLTKIYSYII